MLIVIRNFIDIGTKGSGHILRGIGQKPLRVWKRPRGLSLAMKISLARPSLILWRRVMG